ncbi:farnesol dehydrogenase-like isoform X2 [Photinus pyralis]|uniref:farnesol dehydrogenase-like isoform X2 n=1 Tax=Photinus pyralis TaxID=7054 RepID=UPI0012672765|nr:farnesol dehydrogenase-like isoform X2 [Photinus pyralis]
MVLSMDRWIGKVAVVTGASAGIGAAIVKALAGKGVKVVGLARRKEKIDELTKSLGKKGCNVYAMKADVSKEEDILSSFECIKKKIGPISILINNAGFKRNTNLTDGNTKLWRETFDTNVMGLCIATREAIKNMRECKIDGHIVHLNSIAGHQIPTVVVTNVYPASKFAVTALTETLRLELNAIGSKIKSVSPSTVLTEFRKASNLVEDEKVLSKMPYLDSTDIADAVMYILPTPPHVQVHDIIIHPLFK